MIESWYISGTAVRQFMGLCYLPDQEEGPIFDRCAVELERLCEDAHKHDEKIIGGVSRERWRVNASLGNRGKVRLELIVDPRPREEGDAPQLIAVLDRDERADKST